MWYAYNTEGWYVGEVDPDAPCATPIAPPVDNTTDTPGLLRGRWLRVAWTPETYPSASAPASVTMAQARIAMLRAGITEDMVDNLIAAIPDTMLRAETRIWWERATTVERAHYSVGLLAPALGLDDNALDELFRNAATIAL